MTVIGGQQQNELDLTTEELGRLGVWLSSSIGTTAEVTDATLVAGGRSNLTYRISTTIGQLALRRPPHGERSATAHDVGREYTIMSSLAGTSVPVPAPRGFCDDISVLGAPFYLADFIHGHVIRSAPEAAALPLGVRAAVADRLVATLFAIHTVDLESTGLASLARPGDYIQRQLRRWSRQHGDVADPSPALTRLHAKLSANAPAPGTMALIHGDYRLDNVILDGAGRIEAVLDWELATIGDPLADLASLFITWAGPASEVLHHDGGPTTVPGFGPPEKVLECYEELSGRPLRDFDFYEAFAYWRQACILEGVVDRYRRDMTAGDRTSVDHFVDYIETFAECGSRLVREVP